MEQYLTLPGYPDVNILSTDKYHFKDLCRACCFYNLEKKKGRIISSVYDSSDTIDQHTVDDYVNAFESLLLSFKITDEKSYKLLTSNITYIGITTEAVYLIYDVITPYNIMQAATEEAELLSGYLIPIDTSDGDKKIVINLNNLGNVDHLYSNVFKSDPVCDITKFTEKDIDEYIKRFTALEEIMKRFNPGDGTFSL